MHFTCVCDTAVHSPKQMDLLGLPSNVQRRIALLLEEQPDQAHTGTTVTVFPAPDHASVGTSMPKERSVNVTERSTVWKLSASADNVASQLRQNTASAVCPRAFGNLALEARHITAACSNLYCMPLHFVWTRSLSFLYPRPRAGLQSRSRTSLAASNSRCSGWRQNFASLEGLSGKPSDS